MILTEPKIRELAQSWRSGADDLRNENRDAYGKVPPHIEMAALALESCAARLEAIARKKQV